MTVRLLQWNIWYKENIENILKTIKHINPDIICIQELNIISEFDYYLDKGKVIGDNLNMYYYFEVAQSKGEKPKCSQGNGIFSKFAIEDKYYSFIQNPPTKLIDASSEGRIYIEVCLNINGYQLRVGTTHMSYTKYFINTKKKKREVTRLLDILEGKKGNYIFAGDLNSRPYSFTIKQISKYLKNCGPDIKEKTWTTKPFNYHSFKETELKWRLDYVFCTRDIHILSSQVINTPFSDHLPILIEFKFP